MDPQQKYLRNKSFITDLSPTCIKIKQNSLEFCKIFNKKPSKEYLKSFTSFLPNFDSEERLQSLSKIECKLDSSIPFVTLPKLNDIYNYKLFLASPPMANKLKLKKYPSKKFIIVKQISDTLEKSKKMIFPMKHKMYTSVKYRDASKNLEWLSIAKPEIENIWRNLVCLSNGVKTGYERQSFKYYIGKGNNSALVRRLLSKRPWWVSTENLYEANFVWTQWKEMGIISSLESGKEIQHEIDQKTAPSVKCQTLVNLNQIPRSVDLAELGFQKIKNSASYVTLKTIEFSSINEKVYNKLEFNQHLSNKKGLYKALKSYYDSCGLDVFNYHPVTYHVKNTSNDPNYRDFLEMFKKCSRKGKSKKRTQNIWIVKPGENSNQGQGIKICKSLIEIKEILNSQVSNPRTYILQKYIEKPYLLNKRKFDIRCYAMITSINGVIQGYFYTDGYLRTSSNEYSLKDVNNSYIHLTNDAIQKHSEEYGKFEDNNKLSYREFQRYLDVHSPDKINFFTAVLPQMKNIVKDSIRAVFQKIDSNKRKNCMEIFGYDFMLDEKLKPWIIEVNTNPCLELSSSYLSCLIPAMLENSFKIVLDSLFPSSGNSKVIISENKYELIFHEFLDGKTAAKEVKKDLYN